jgi:hypothetical protein
MAKKQPTQESQMTDPNRPDTPEEIRAGQVSLVKAQTQGLAIPDAEAGNRAGLEHLQQADLKMPRLALAQKMSHEVDPDDPRYIDNLRVGDLFNDLTQQVYEQPLQFTVVRADPPHWIEFNPRDQGGGVKEMNVPEGDPRTLFTKDANGKSIPPVATKFYEYILMLLPSQEIVSLSLKSTGIPVAKQLNGLMFLRNAPCYAGRYEMSSGEGKNAKGIFKVYKLKNAGKTPDEDRVVASQMFENLQGRIIDINRVEDVDDSMAANPEDGGPQM